MNGTIYQLEKDKPRGKCRKWKLQVSLGRNFATGKYDKAFRNFSGTYTEAQKALRDLIAEVESNKLAIKTDDYFESYSAQWLERRKETVAHGTWRKNVDHIKCANMHLAKAKLHEITPKVLEATYRALMDGKSPSGKKLSGAYVGCIASSLHRLFEDAIRDNLLQVNPCDRAIRPKNDTAERKSLPIEAIHELVANLDPTDPPQLVALMILKSGIRRGEVHGLSIGDIEGNVVHVRHNMDDGGNLKETKTKKGTRDLPLTQSLRKDIERRKEQIEKDFAKTGLFITNKTPLICNELGERILPHSSSRWWARNRARLGYEGWTLHEMRHSYLSELARRGVEPKVLQEIAGHESFKTTMDIYVHVGMEDKLKAVSVVDW